MSSPHIFFCHIFASTLKMWSLTEDSLSSCSCVMASLTVFFFSPMQNIRLWGWWLREKKIWDEGKNEKAEYYIIKGVKCFKIRSLRKIRIRILRWRKKSYLRQFFVNVTQVFSVKSKLNNIFNNLVLSELGIGYPKIDWMNERILER